MRIHFFKRITIPASRVYDISFSEFYDAHLQTCAKLNDKKDSLVFSFADYENNERGNAVNFVSGLIFDFDGVTSEMSPDRHEDCMDGHEWAWYRTHSYSIENPRYRIVLPFEEPISPNLYIKAATEFYEYMGLPDGLDSSCFEYGRGYFLPAMPDPTLYESKYYPGDPVNVCDMFNIKDTTKIYSIPKILPAPNYANRGGRNQALKSQASACLDKEVPFMQCVQELIEYDKANHTPPLFEDGSEFNGIVDSGLNAITFVSRIWSSHVRKSGETPNIFDEQNPDQLDIITEAPKKKKKFFTIPNKLALNAPGLVGEITRWVTETAPYPQPALALGAALATVGVLKGHKVQGDTGLRTNLYCLGFANSGAGKNHPLTLCKLLLRHSNNHKLIMGEPSSDGGLLTGIREGGEKGLLLWDEFGEALRHMTEERATVWHKRIMEEMTKLFSSANSFYAGKQRANGDGKNPRADFDQPCFSFYGVTNFRSFSESVTEHHVRNGFLPRFLPFSAENDRIGDFRKHQLVSVVPPSILEKVQAICELPENAYGGNLERNPKVVKMEPDAEELMDEIDRTFHDKIRQNQEERGEDGDYLDAIWARGAEHVRKVALTICNNDIITLTDLDWALQVVTICTESMHDIALNEVDITPFNRHCESMYNLILSKTPSGGCPRTYLHKAFKPKQKKLYIDQVLDTLKDAGRVKEVHQGSARTLFAIKQG